MDPMVLIVLFVSVVVVVVLLTMFFKTPPAIATRGGAKNVKLSYFGLLGLLIGSLFLGGVINNNLLR